MAAQFVIQAVREKGTKRKNGEFENSQQERCIAWYFTHVLSAWRNSIEKQNGRGRYELKFVYVFYPLRKLILTLVSILGNHALYKILKPLDNGWPWDIQSCGKIHNYHCLNSKLISLKCRKMEPFHPLFVDIYHQEFVPDEYCIFVRNFGRTPKYLSSSV